MVQNIEGQNLSPDHRFPGVPLDRCRSLSFFLLHHVSIFMFFFKFVVFGDLFVIFSLYHFNERCLHFSVCLICVVRLTKLATSRVGVWSKLTDRDKNVHRIVANYKTVRIRLFDGIADYGGPKFLFPSTSGRKRANSEAGSALRRVINR